MYTVHSKRPRRFATLEEASKYASLYYSQTGIIVAITRWK